MRRRIVSSSYCATRQTRALFPLQWMGVSQQFKRLEVADIRRMFEKFILSPCINIVSFNQLDFCGYVFGNTLPASQQSSRVFFCGISLKCIYNCLELSGKSKRTKKTLLIFFVLCSTRK